ncbi:Signal transduction histidine kinase [Candidatus Nitrosarchaeum limnium SFB1]|jgi:PAS domain S-box-containing protein|uniref:Signal transduction histidine kinase n=1 Tax=Candidatus Nitrosarchaeum limnium SFB1 TaxID=886738 RepID=F3KKN6_9ARCH|nr:Signal transduction histidine kinase [Candidatus Nitrosarchaeum limnium SFB1]
MSDTHIDFQKITNDDMYRSIYENSPDLFRTININGEIINCNKSYFETLGYLKSEVIGKTIFDHTAEESLSQMRETFEEWKKGGCVSNSEIWLKKKNGDKFLALLSANNLFDKYGTLIGSNTSIRDITEITAMKKEFKNLKRIRQEIMGELSIRVAHDLKNPLNVIKNSVQLIQFRKEPSTENYSNTLTRIEHAVIRMDHQINEVLEFVNPLPLDLQQNSLKKIFENVINEMPVPEEFTVSIPTKDIMINCDQRKIEIILRNLVLNAIQAMGEKGSIIITTNETESHVKILVKDTGPGIPHKLRFKIFDPLFTTRQIGTGLGLPICKTVIEQHGGSISFETELEKGTTFTISLPKSL